MCVCVYLLVQCKYRILIKFKAVPHGQRASFCNCYKRLLHAVSYRYVWLADVRELQNPWELSGKFEGDIVLTEEQVRNGLINTASRWRGKTVPFYIDPVFSEYCSTKLLIGMGGVEGNMRHYV